MDLSSIYDKTRMTRILAIRPSMLTSDIENNILSVLRKDVEDKVVPEGYVEKGSVEIKNHGPLMTEVIRFNGYTRVDVTFTANVCNPTKGDILECEVKRFNQFGIRAVAGPLNIVILEKKGFQVSAGQILKVRVVARQLLLNNNQINVVAQLLDTEEISLPDEEIPLNDEDLESDIEIISDDHDIQEDGDEGDDEEDEDEDEDENDLETQTDDEKEAQEGGYNLAYNVKDEENDGDFSKNCDIDDDYHIDKKESKDEDIDTDTDTNISYDTENDT